jgi:hypothetical protein
MPTIHTAHGPCRFAVLIPSRGRAPILAKSLKKMPWLDDVDTFILVEKKEWDAYAEIRDAFPTISYTGQGPWWGGSARERGASPIGVFGFDNPSNSVAVARERLRQHVTSQCAYDAYVVTDDNAVHASEAALHNLVRARAEWAVQPCIMAGMHNTAPHFDRGKIPRAVTVHGLRSYPSVAMIFQCYPHDLYAQYRYPSDAFGLDDRHFFLWAIQHGVTQFRVCMDAPFTKSRYQDGGQGDIATRLANNGRAIARLAMDFPRHVGATGTLRLPWQLILDMEKGKMPDRLVAGAMRKEADLLTGTTPASAAPSVRVRRVRRATPLTKE